MFLTNEFGYINNNIEILNIADFIIIKHKRRTFHFMGRYLISSILR